MPSLLDYLVLTTSLFIIGLCGIVSNRTNLLIILIRIEVVLFSIDINFVIFSVYLDDICGQVFALFILTVAASAIGLAIVVVYYRLQDKIVLPSIVLVSPIFLDLILRPVFTDLIYI
jgi:NADH-quinone oxidoreductase subunit K